MDSKNYLPTIKNTALIKPVAKKLKAPQGLHQLNQYEESLNKMWDMFQQQLQRNMELMTLLTQQQQLQFDKIIMPAEQPTPAEGPAAFKQQLINPATNKEKHLLCNSFDPLPYDRLSELVRNFRLLCPPHSNIRLDALQSTINLLYHLHCLEGDVTREEVIQATSLSESSFARYSDTLYKHRLLSRSGSHRNRTYKVTALGVKFLNLEEFTEEEKERISGWK